MDRKRGILHLEFDQTFEWVWGRFQDAASTIFDTQKQEEAGGFKKENRIVWTELVRWRDLVKKDIIEELFKWTHWSEPYEKRRKTIVKKLWK